MSTDNRQRDIEAEINKLISAQTSNADLLLILGGADGALFASPGDKKIRGLQLLRNAIGEIRNTICNNEFARALGEDKSNSTQRSALAVAATLDFFGTVGAATASLLIIQIGLENVCAGRWEQHVK